MLLTLAHPVASPAAALGLDGFSRMPARRIVSAATLLAFLAAGIGLPVPQVVRPSLPKHADEDYPCRDHACGCLNAAMCRAHCCCFPHRPRRVASCCAVRKTRPKPTTTPKRRDRRHPLGLAIDALGCRGVVSLSWVSLVDVFPPLRATQRCSTARPAGRLMLSRGRLLPQAFLQPETPPPRV